MPQHLQFAEHVERQLEAIRRTVVGQPALRLSPNPFVGVELRRVGGQELEMQARNGWTPQKPERRARERDEDAIARWKRTRWPRVKRGLFGWGPTSSS